jgi:beta-lactamase class A
VAGAVLAAVLAGCTGGADGDAATAPASPTRTAPAAVGLPDSPVGEAAGWVLRVLAGDEAPPTAELERRFAPAFLTEVPAADLAALLVQLQADGPYVPVAVDPQDATAEAELTAVTRAGEFVSVQLGVGPDGRIETLWFGPGVDPERPRPATWAELEEHLAAVDARSSMLIARLGEDGRCEPVAGAPGGSDRGEVLPLGSVVKLYVLGAVVQAVGDGTLAWEEPLTVTDDVRSLPSGRLQDAPTGTVVTVREAAEQMIAVSDNTATDLLVARVGREAVEAAQATMGHHDPARNTPMLTTRDLFRVGWGDPALRAAWSGGGTAERRALLDGLPGGVLEVDPAAVTDPAWQDGADWFATSADLCAAHAWLHAAAGTGAGAPVREVLSANPGVRVDATDWPYVAFKGGSAPGVLAGTWLAEGDDGTYVVTLQLAADDPAALARPHPLVDAAEGALEILAAGRG